MIQSYFKRLRRAGTQLWLGILFIILGVALAPKAGLHTVPEAGASTNIVQPDTAIGTITFVGGRLVQDLNAYGRWTEYDLAGNTRYSFREFSSDATYLKLRGETGRVELWVDLKNKVILGQWPNHPLAEIYKVTHIDTLMFAQTSPPNVTPSPKAPKNNADVIIDRPVVPVVIPPQKGVITGATLTSAQYKGGRYEIRGENKWVHIKTNGQKQSFTKLGHDPTSVFLYDSSRRSFVELDTVAKVARISQGQGLLTHHSLYALKSGPHMVGTPVTPSVPQTPIEGRLSAQDRVACVQSGGTVERAGMLGYERCTRRYSDGGKVCLDSADCQGKCLAEDFTDRNTNARGQCQMTDNPFGCYAEVVDGVVGPGLCVD